MEQVEQTSTVKELFGEDFISKPEEKNDPYDTPELNEAARIFGQSVPRAKALASNMSRNALARVYNAVLEFPLADRYPTFRNKNENELFILTLAVNNAKAIMTNAFTKGREQEIVETVTDNVVKEILEEQTQKEVNNG